MTTPDYKGAPLEAARGPGLGCFWLQVGVLAFLLVLTPVGVINAWPIAVTGGLLFLTLLLLLFAGQTVIFLLRLVAADRRARRRPLRAGHRPTVGELEDAEAPGDDDQDDRAGDGAARRDSGARSVDRDPPTSVAG